MATYSEKLKSPKWQKKRLEILQRDEFTCQHFNDKENTLHVHHIAYSGNPWEQLSDEFWKRLNLKIKEDRNNGRT